MNWFIYIGGWIVGWMFFNGSVNGDTWVKLAAWSFIWFCICLKFIQ